MLNQNIVREATRLTRAGQLVEATALLQRMLRGESAPRTNREHCRVPCPRGLEPPTIDVKANVVEEKKESRRADHPGFFRSFATQKRRPSSTA